MPRIIHLAAALQLLFLGFVPTLHSASIDSNMVVEIDGKKIFPIGFTMPPPPDGKTPEGKDAIAELAAAGATMLRTGPMGTPWDEACIEREFAWLNAARRHGLYCMPYIRDFGVVSSDAKEMGLRNLVRNFKNHPALLAWKGDDEPEWGRKPVDHVRRAYEIVKEEDPNHPLVIIHAPRGTVESLRAYNPAADIIGADIYPVGYPPGTHSLLTNKTLSLVGDHTRIMMQVAGGKKPVWMVLQIAWSGVIKPGKTLRFPTAFEERFMTYQAIINGARGLIYFGGSIQPAMNEQDKALGWNWTFWKRVLRPVIEEIGSHSPLYPALVAPDSKLRLKVTRGKQIEFCVREVDGTVFILACKAGGVTEEVQFGSLPDHFGKGQVLFEAPRSVQATAGSFKDWFAPYEVHVYRFDRESVKATP